MLRLSRDSECSNSVIKPRYVHRLDVVRYCKHHVCAGHPHSRRTFLTETLKGAHQPINVGLDLRLLKVYEFISRLVGCGIGHKGMATRAEGGGRALPG